MDQPGIRLVGRKDCAPVVSSLGEARSTKVSSNRDREELRGGIKESQMKSCWKLVGQERVKGGDDKWLVFGGLQWWLGSTTAECVRESFV